MTQLACKNKPHRMLLTHSSFFSRRLLYSFLPQGEYVNYSIAKRHKQLLTSQPLSYALRNLEGNKEGSPKLRISASCTCIACIFIYVYIIRNISVYSYITTRCGLRHAGKRHDARTSHDRKLTQISESSFLTHLADRG